ncbi:hypothetical protein [Aureibacter tunicatorum]|uniref:Uncharacterized protein n=1 Tax=Aureibacter tunicatorum TaxID=866807 RepID=A0AAE3XT10_9BACT|nr:hypothetical protein [Aureibacter tunicatorum]MDR6241084.1 hypothetical protein [Aureibacter tunicatorum]BDD03862.1 hypothetical protein AUTU_13450 [Aureibacter tunicatorum]
MPYLIDNHTHIIPPITNSKESIFNRIDQDLFDDIYRLSSQKNLNELIKTHNKYLSRWKIKEIQYPVLLLSNNGLDDNFDTYERLEYYFEGYSYEVEDGQFIIDSNGDRRKLEFWNFGHPIGVVFPSKEIIKFTNKKIDTLTKGEIPNWVKQNQ